MEGGIGAEIEVRANVVTQLEESYSRSFENQDFEHLFRDAAGEAAWTQLSDFVYLARTDYEFEMAAKPEYALLAAFNLVKGCREANAELIFVSIKQSLSSEYEDSHLSVDQLRDRWWMLVVSSEF